MIKYENETRLNQDKLIDLLAKQTLPTSRLVFTIVSDLVLMLIVILNFDKENPGLYIALLVLLSIAVVVTVLLIVGKKWLIKIGNKSLSNGVVYKYVFYENEFSIDSIINDKTTHLVMKYEGLEKIIIKDDFAYLYIDNASIFFVDMNEFGLYKEEVLKLFAPFKKKKKKR